METYACIKCNTKYQSSDDEAYLCEACLLVKESIAKTMDKTYSTVGQVPQGMATQMEQIAREKGGYAEGTDSQGNKISRVFVNVKDLGLL
jgi:uncharacterized protein (DUF885 family)